MLNENCSPRSRDESNFDLKIESECRVARGSLFKIKFMGLPVGEGAGVVDVHLVPCPWLAFTLALHLQRSVVER